MSSVIDIHSNEIGLVNSYMRRLDVTTNIAITFAGISVSVAFAGPGSTPFPIVLAIILSLLFLLMEARTARELYLHKFRARILEACFFPRTINQGMSAPRISEDLLVRLYSQDDFQFRILIGAGDRIRFAYRISINFLVIAYFGTILLHPSDVESIEDIMLRAHIGPIPGWVALIIIVMPTLLLEFINAMAHLERRKIAKHIASEIDILRSGREDSKATPFLADLAPEAARDLRTTLPN